MRSSDPQRERNRTIDERDRPSKGRAREPKAEKPTERTDAREIAEQRSMRAKADPSAGGDTRKSPKWRGGRSDQHGGRAATKGH